MYNMGNTHKSLTNFTEMPDISNATMINLTEFNITQTELLFWLDNNTKVKHVLKDENYYHIFFNNENEYKILSEFLGTKFSKAA